MRLILKEQCPTIPGPVPGQLLSLELSLSSTRHGPEASSLTCFPAGLCERLWRPQHLCPCLLLSIHILRGEVGQARPPSPFSLKVAVLGLSPSLGASAHPNHLLALSC